MLKSDLLTLKSVDDPMKTDVDNKYLKDLSMDITFKAKFLNEFRCTVAGSDPNYQFRMILR